MEIPDIITLYFPPFAELPAAQVQTTRQRLQALLHAGFPDIDYRPNSPLGDMQLTPFAYLFAGVETAIGRFMSDLDTGNVAKNIIWNCFSRDTAFVTRGGVKTFEDFGHGDTTVVRSHTGAWQNATIQQYGQQQLTRIVVRQGRLRHVVRATKEHSWLLRDGTRTTKLQVGDTLMEAPHSFKQVDYLADYDPAQRLAWAYGYIFGNGSLMHDADKNPRWSSVRVCGYGKEIFAERFQKLGFPCSSPKSFGGDPIFYTGAYLKEAPDPTQESLEMLEAFVRGYLDADGAKNPNKASTHKAQRKEYLSIQATGKKHCEFIEKVFPIVGQYITGAASLDGEITNFGPRGKHTKAYRLNNTLHAHAPKFVVESIEPDVVETVWCLDVEEDHSFVLPFGVCTGNCEYVRRFLQGFAVADSATLQSFGVARFTFIADQDYVLDRRAQYKFGNDVFHLRFANPGPFLIRSVGAPLSAGTNARNLVDVGGGYFCADLPVVGVMSAAVAAGNTATTDYPIAELASVAALEDFSFGLPPSSLPVLAEKTRTTFYSATPSSPGGAVRFLLREFPELVGASAATSGDLEMLRDVVNPLGIMDGKLDLYAASPAVVEDTLIVSLKYDSTSHIFSGKLLPNGIPFKLDNVTAVDAPAVTLTYGSDAKIYSQSRASAKAPLASCAYSSLEDLWLVIDMPFDTVSGSPTEGDALIPLREDADGNPVGVFQLLLRQDPMLPVVVDAVEAPGAMPFGVDVLAKGFVPIIIDSFLVKYTRRPGTIVNVDQARQEILAHVNRLAAPEFYSDARIGDAMFAAGAADMVGIEVRAHVQWSLANAFFPSTATPASALAGAISAAIVPHAVTIAETADLKISFRDPYLGTSNACFGAVGLRNSMLVLDTDNLLFSEI